MTTKKFVIKIIRKCVVFALLMIVVAAIGQSVSPIVSNQVALGQMQNSDEMYVLMNTYNKIRPIVSFAFAGIILLFTGTIARDIYKFVKTTIENKKEN